MRPRDNASQYDDDITLGRVTPCRLHKKKYFNLITALKLVNIMSLAKLPLLDFIGVLSASLVVNAQDAEKPRRKGKPSKVIIGAVIGGTAFFCLILLFIIFNRRRKGKIEHPLVQAARENKERTGHSFAGWRRGNANA
ncbi:hypothetical protein BKA70DRAFT_593486 [Coprinopsis sp. MPI-PUGE-AT-0042]|nr:hypothetical protein BKA70DRAFT_593486 [Coprinopsis sp. MPI-PUGE-AT-0042]